MKFSPNIKYIIGIDEAGRGPLAGPVAVGVCLLPSSTSRNHFRGIRDSKKLTEKMRDEWFSKMREKRRSWKKLLKNKENFQNGMIQNKEDISNLLDFSVTLISNKTIDRYGITYAIKKAIRNSLKILERRNNFNCSECFVLLDGSLRAPTQFPFQKTIIKGDEKEFPISLASVAAKVTRDAYMKKISAQVQDFEFAAHKGYGTKKHIELIKKQGISVFHRTSFLGNII